MRKEFSEIGKIVGTHGIRGMVRMEFWADDAEFLKKFKIFYLEDKTPVEITKISPHGNIVLAAIKGVDTVEAAENYRGKVLSVKRDEMDIPKGRYLIGEIIGAKVYNSETNELLGILTDVMKTGANDVWQIENNGKEYLVPVIKDIDIKVDIDNDVIFIKPLKGIFDDED